MYNTKTTMLTVKLTGTDKLYGEFIARGPEAVMLPGVTDGPSLSTHARLMPP
jgi:hypothetical protein